jgi:hypothetical protein
MLKFVFTLTAHLFCRKFLLCAGTLDDIPQTINRRNTVATNSAGNEVNRVFYERFFRVDIFACLFYILTLVLSVAPGRHDLYLRALSRYESYIYSLLYSLLNCFTTIVGKSLKASSRLQEFDKSHVGDVGV